MNNESEDERGSIESADEEGASFSDQESNENCNFNSKDMPRNPQLVSLLKSEESFAYDPNPTYKDYKTKIRLTQISRSQPYEPVIISDNHKTQAKEGSIL